MIEYRLRAGSEPLAKARDTKNMLSVGSDNLRKPFGSDLYEV